jgi:hypothetical protein
LGNDLGNVGRLAFGVNGRYCGGAAPTSTTHALKWVELSTFFSRLQVHAAQKVLMLKYRVSPTSLVGTANDGSPSRDRIDCVYVSNQQNFNPGLPTVRWFGSVFSNADEHIKASPALDLLILEPALWWMTNPSFAWASTVLQYELEPVIPDNGLVWELPSSESFAAADWSAV